MEQADFEEVLQQVMVPVPDSTHQESEISMEDACGIIAFVGSEPAANFLLEGLTILQNRGYDSAGVCTISESGELVCTKYASENTTSDAIDKVRDHLSDHRDNTIGIAHTRWATHGGKTDLNSHPHFDEKRRVAVVHNGVIENYAELKKELVDSGVKFVSETDTEVIAQLIGRHLEDGMPIQCAVQKSLARMEGTWGLAILCRDTPDQIIAARNGSPLLIGVGQGRMFIASEPSAFARYTKQMIALENKEVALVRADDRGLDLKRIETAETEEVALSPAPFPHWTIKEIWDQPEAIARSLNYGGRILDETKVKLGGLEKNRDVLLGVEHLVIAACGTSLHAGMLGAQVMRTLNSFNTIEVVDAAELTRDHIPRSRGGLLVISQSGETKDVHRCLLLAEELDVPRFSIVNVVGSLIARSTKCGVYTNAGREIAVASTKAFTSQCVALVLVAAWFSQNREQEVEKRSLLIESLHRLPTNIGMTLRCHERCKEVAAQLAKKEHMFILGKGLGEPVAREGALKIKEITYIHAEGYAAGALKHGPFALIESGTPVILVILDDGNATSMRSAAHEVRARGAFVVGITDNPKVCSDVCDAIIPIPRNNGSLSAICAVLPLQVLAYELALARGIDPDKPRNLAKAVTVY